MGVTLVYPLESPNPGAGLPDMLLGAPLGLWFGSEAVMCWCFYRCVTYFRKDTWWGVGIYCVPPSGALITSNMNSLRYLQILDFLTLVLLPNLLILSSGGRWRAAEIDSYGSMPLTLGTDKDSYRFTYELWGWANLLGTLVGLEYTSIGLWVKLLQDSSGIGIVDETVVLLLVSEFDRPRGLW